jgi:acetoacetyl-CoA synthetase
MSVIPKTPLWTPQQERSDSSNMRRFMHSAAATTGESFQAYADLYRWSINRPSEFWELIWREAQIVHSQEHSSVMEGQGMFGTTWFTGAKLNFAENLLRHRNRNVAIVSLNESGVREELTYAELFGAVARCAKGLIALGVTQGDRVAAFFPNVAQAVIAMLATTSIGALWSSCSPDFGLPGVLARFEQIAPKVLLGVDSYTYQGMRFDCLERLRRISKQLSSLEKVVVVNTSSPESDSVDSRDTNSLFMSWSNLLDNDAQEVEFAQLPFDHPVYIVYSSGTTGAPKCIVHGAGGTLLQHWKEHVLHTNLSSEDVIIYYTTCGWMMWNWLVSSLAVGATVILYDGSPAHPNLASLWRVIESERITVFGTSPKFLTTCQKQGLNPADRFDLSSLNTVLSTGSPLTDENFRWVYQSVKDDLQLSSISGGADILSCFMLGNPTLPVYSGEIQCCGLGMKVEAFDENGASLIEEVGELVCTAPFPSQPIAFWNDSDNSKYRAAYFERYPGIWRHGDFIKITDNGGVIVYGRSDTTLNRGGVRIGAAEIYNPVEALPEVLDSIVIGQKWKDDIRIVLFVVLRDGLTLTEVLSKKIRTAIRENSTPRHVPNVILQVTDIPRTISGKKVELAVLAAVNGDEQTNLDSLANPVALKQYSTVADSDNEMS